MTLFGLSPKFPQSSENRESFSVSLSEAVLDSSSCDRARVSLPKQHRARFDELRRGILAFCDEFHIPVSALSNKATFERELTSKKIPSPRMAEVVLLFQRLEYLLVHKEPLKEEPTESLEYAEQFYNLSEQYEDQVNLLKDAGILDKDDAMTGIDGQKYPIPTLEQIAEHLCSPEQKEILRTKHDQGFTKLLLVPFGMSLTTLISLFKLFLLDYQHDHPDFSLDDNEPLWTREEVTQGIDMGDHPELVYFPKSYIEEEHQGKTKAQILKDQTQDFDAVHGWRMLLLQSSDPGDPAKGIAPIPRENKREIRGKEMPRPDLKADTISDEYLSSLVEAKDDPTSPYYYESGMTPEDWFVAFMTHLRETGQPLDNHRNGKDSIAHLTGSFFPRLVYAPSACWNEDFHQAGLDLSPAGGHWNKGNGIRSSVAI